ncbi:glycosyltransferase family 2 protein [Bacillus sp. AK128]
MNNQSPLVSIVMLAWNRKEDVRESLIRINEVCYNPFEVIVVDNASNDGTQDMVETEFPDVKLIRMYKNIGIEAYNIGFENAKGDYIIIIDDDSFPARNALTLMVEQFEQDPYLGGVAFDVRNFYTYDDIRRDTKDETNHPIASASNYVLGFNGAGVGIRSNLFRKIGYYPEEFFLYHNELDTAFRIMNEGFHIKFFSTIVSYHKYSPVNRASWRAPYYYTRNAFWIIWKYYPINIAIKETVSLFNKCIFHSFEQRTLVYLKAFYSAYSNTEKLKGKRKPLSAELVNRMRTSFDLVFTFFR